jgi:hypothetical protein
MALLNSFIDVRTLASLASNGSVSFAHGLPAAPDFVIVEQTGTGTVAATVGGVLVNKDATNVTLFAQGLATQPLRVTSVVAHSIIR